MDDEPMDLRGLDVEDPPDAVREAFRQFRWRVVLITAAAVALASVVVAWGTIEIVQDRNLSQALAESRQLSAPAQAIHDVGGLNCRTPSYAVEGVEVSLLQAAPMRSSNMAVHALVHSRGVALSEQRAVSGGGSVMRSISLRVVGGKAAPLQAVGPEWTFAEVYLEVPAARAETFSVEVVGPSHGDVLGSFAVDLTDLGLRVLESPDGSWDLTSSC